MTRMFGMQSLMLQAHGRLITPEDIAKVEIQYSLNDHAHAMLGIRPLFVELLDDDISSDPDANKSDMEDDEVEDANDSSAEED